MSTEATLLEIINAESTIKLHTFKNFCRAMTPGEKKDRLVMRLV